MTADETLYSGYPERIFHSFLVRCWQDADAGPNREQAWRFLLVQFDNQQKRLCFASLDELVDYFRKELLKTVT